MRESPVQIKLVIALPDHTQGKRKRKCHSRLRGQWHSPLYVTARFLTDLNATEDHPGSAISSTGQGLAPNCCRHSSLLKTASAWINSTQR